MTYTVAKAPLSLVVVAAIRPVLETNPERLSAMADATSYFAGVASRTGKVGMAETLTDRANFLRSLI